MPQNLSKIYLDTSVVSNYFDKRDKNIHQATRKFWKLTKETQVFVSIITLQELNAIKDKQRKLGCLKLIQPFQILEMNERAIKLAKSYIKAKIIPAKHLNDAYHIAIASVNNIPIILSWNFDHIVKRKTKLETNAINILQGYSTIQIYTPAELT